MAQKATLFGTGTANPDRIFRIGPNPELVGRPAVSAGRSDARASIADAGELRDVDLRSATVPAWVTGRVSGGAGPPKDIAVAVNGTVRAVGNTFRLATGGRRAVRRHGPARARSARGPTAFRCSRSAAGACCSWASPGALLLSQAVLDLLQQPRPTRR